MFKQQAAALSQQTDYSVRGRGDNSKNIEKLQAEAFSSPSTSPVAEEDPGTAERPALSSQSTLDLIREFYFDWIYQKKAEMEGGDDTPDLAEPG